MEKLGAAATLVVLPTAGMLTGVTVDAGFTGTRMSVLVTACGFVFVTVGDTCFKVAVGVITFAIVVVLDICAMALAIAVVVAEVNADDWIT